MRRTVSVCRYQKIHREAKRGEGRKQRQRVGTVWRIGGAKDKLYLERSENNKPAGTHTLKLTPSSAGSCQAHTTNPSTNVNNNATPPQRPPQLQHNVKSIRRTNGMSCTHSTREGRTAHLLPPSRGRQIAARVLHVPGMSKRKHHPKVATTRRLEWNRKHETT